MAASRGNVLLLAVSRESEPQPTVAHLRERSEDMTVGTLLLVLLILVVVGALPTWPHSKNWGYYPSGALGVIVLVLLVLVFMGRV